MAVVFDDGQETRLWYDDGTQANGQVRNEFPALSRQPTVVAANDYFVTAYAMPLLERFVLWVDQNKDGRQSSDEQVIHHESGDIVVHDVLFSGSEAVISYQHDEKLKIWKMNLPLQPKPVITRLEPAVASTEGQGTIYIHGSHFQSGVSVEVDGFPAASVSRISSNLIRIETPILREGRVPIFVINPDERYNENNGHHMLTVTAPPKACDIGGSSCGETQECIDEGCYETCGIVMEIQPAINRVVIQRLSAKIMGL